mmetsp:Transcript_7705/g.22563  ORF Transcript_7705/g.22563 Transcript_7705/m.22563 type:complete len:136 (-) Transcript_7705:228-635(-)
MRSDRSETASRDIQRQTERERESNNADHAREGSVWDNLLGMLVIHPSRKNGGVSLFSCRALPCRALPCRAVPNKFPMSLSLIDPFDSLTSFVSHCPWFVSSSISGYLLPHNGCGTRAPAVVVVVVVVDEERYLPG